MFFLSNLFRRKPQEPEPPRTRQDMEESFSVNELQTYTYETPQGILQNTFQKKRPAQEEEKKLLKETFDLIASVPQGKKLLDEVAAAGYDVYFETFHSKNFGCMYANQKKIMLSSCMLGSAAEMASSAVHEMTHALQQERTGYLGHKGAELTLADQFKFTRAAEAAAWAEQAKFSYQIREQHPEVERLTGDFPMYRAFVEEMEKSGDMGKAGEAAFKSWYGFKHYQTSYENDHVSNFTFSMEQGYANHKEILTGTISSDEVLQQVFLSDDLRQQISPEFLTSKEAFSISENAIERLDRSAMIYNGRKTDPTLRDMYSYTTGQTYASQERPKEAAAASARPPMMTALKNIAPTPKIEPSLAAKVKERAAQH
ncbi:MAG: hypothetical protein IJ752_07545 [Alphaproteobacteria bacterium]|nr:hypothetical protein [Alphaproteobacteria bacterium]